MEACSSRSTNRARERTLPEANGDDAIERQHKMLQVARAELALVCSVACKMAAVLFVLEGLFWIAALGDPLAPGVVTAAAAGPQGAALQHDRNARAVR
jgi:hypothetical protein